eukprot:11217031-Lingulodinium_polyedra.AAC.1
MDSGSVEIRRHVARLATMTSHFRGHGHVILMGDCNSDFTAMAEWDRHQYNECEDGGVQVER